MESHTDIWKKCQGPRSAAELVKKTFPFIDKKEVINIYITRPRQALFKTSSLKRRDPIAKRNHSKKERNHFNANKPPLQGEPPPLLFKDKAFSLCNEKAPSKD
eukprot:4345096-Amphidinium_carterae.1